LAKANAGSLLQRSMREPGLPIQVEFFGLPGSGKTTIARELYSRLRSADPDVIYGPLVTLDSWPMLPRTAARALMIVRGLPWRRSDRRALHAMMTTRQRTGRDKAKVLFSFLTVASVYRRLARRGCGAVVDQGILQTIWSANLHSAEPFSPTKWAPLLRSESRTGRFYVFVRTPVPICMERLSSRPSKHSRMQSRGALRDAERWEHSELVCGGVLEGLTSSLREQGSPARVMTVDGTRDPSELAEGILARVLEANASLALVSRDLDMAAVN
jgi:hypothetical protein